MRQTIVPAQVTTVEDKIAGNISFKQLLLLVTPVFFGGALYVLLPPFMGYTSYKIALWAIFALTCGMLAIRVKGRLIVEWLVIRGRYNSRSSHFVYNKNTTSMRPEPVEIPTAKITQPVMSETVLVQEELADDSLHRLEQILLEPKANLIFRTTKKGGLRVSIKEIK
jgi:hypothetical protein